MRVLIFGGSGKIGSAAAWDLAQDKEIQTIGLVGRHRSDLTRIRKWIGSRKIALHVLDIQDKQPTIKLMRQYQVGIITLPNRKASYHVVRMAIEAGLNIVNALEEFHRRPDHYETEGLELPKEISLDGYGEWLHQKATAKGITFVDGMGFAPGLSNITLGEGIRKMDMAEEAVARVGGIPTKEAADRHPLKYMITWAFEHVLREYMVKVKVIKKGKATEVDAGTGREQFIFNQLGKKERLECAITPGMPSFLFTRPQLKEFTEKTVRWPGHWQGIQTLKECGLLDIKPVNFKGMRIIPREFLSFLITPKLIPHKGEADACVMYNTLTGRKNGQRIKKEYFMWEEADTKNNLSAMMRVTAFPLAITARLLLKGLIKDKGIVPPEDAIKGKVYKIFIAELKKRKIRILETQQIIP